MTLGGHYAASHAHKHLNLSISTPATYFLTKLSNQDPANINITSSTLWKVMQIISFVSKYTRRLDEAAACEATGLIKLLYLFFLSNL